MGGKGSGRTRHCPHCKQVLYCKACGRRVTPKPRGGRPKKSVAFRIEPGKEEELRKAAEAAGVSLSEYLNRLVSGGRDGKDKKTKKD